MIIPCLRVLTTQYPIAATTTIEPGMVVTLNTSTGYAEKANAGDEANIVGIAADRNRASESFEWTNRVSDSGNDTAASGMLSVYSGGEFYVDMDDSAITTPNGTSIAGVIVAGTTTTPGTLLYAAATNGGADDGKMGVTSGSAAIVALCLEEAASLDAGIPGEYEPNSINYVTDGIPRTWVKIRLLK